jgi:hypothetical protein
MYHIQQVNLKMKAAVNVPGLESTADEGFTISRASTRKHGVLFGILLRNLDKGRRLFRFPSHTEDLQSLDSLIT